MLFNSSEFLFFFLPAVVLGFLWLQRLGQRRLIIAWLTACSLFFYAWWNPVYLLLLALSASVNYSIGLRLARQGQSSQGWLATGIVFNLGLLAWFKYANFFVDNINDVLATGFNFEVIVLPLAISFYTFQQITYLVDTRKGLTEPHGLLEYSLFVCFFPQLIAGPIVHHSEMLTQFKHLDERGNTGRNLTLGCSILVIGLFKKVVIADGFAHFATPVFSLAAAGQALHTLDALAGTLSYAFQLYFDFSGYSDMAIGLACLFGIRLPVNFFSPYRAQNISDFWRMWHATLSRFLRDYIYAPLGGFFCSPNRQRFNLFATLFAGGVWHGAGWTFVAYGLCHGIYVVVHQLWRVRVSGPLELVGNRYYKMAAQGFTFTVVVLTLVLFRADSVGTAVYLYSCLLDPASQTFVPAYVAELRHSNLFRIEAILSAREHGLVVVYTALALALAACWLLPSTYQLFQREQVAIDKPVAGRAAVWQLQWQASAAWAVFIAVLALASLMNLSEVSEFLYFQF